MLHHFFNFSREKKKFLENCRFKNSTILKIIIIIKNTSNQFLHFLK